MYHSSFASIESVMVHFKNHIGVDDIITKRGESGIVDYDFLKGLNRYHRLYFCIYKNGFNSPTVLSSTARLVFCLVVYNLRLG